MIKNMSVRKIIMDWSAVQRSTISTSHGIDVKVSMSCDKLTGACDGASRDTAFSFSLYGLPDERPQFQPSSSSSTIRDVYGHSFTGYAIVGHSPSFTYHHQRPALEH